MGVEVSQKILECVEIAKEHQLTRAYPIKMLEESYFREMLQVYTPGLLIIADNGDGGVVGFTTGGNIKLGELIEKNIIIIKL